MLNIKSIAIYLLYKKVVSNHSLTKWITLLDVQERVYDLGVFPGVTFIERVRELHEKRLISTAVASLLLQISLWKHEAEELVERLKKCSIECYCCQDTGYPIGIKHIPDAPFVLFIRGGNVNLDPSAYITIVGTRNPSVWGQKCAKQITKEAILLSYVTVSGQARGVDQIVLRESIKAGGKTIVVVPELDISAQARHNIIEISEYLKSDLEVHAWQYVARNRIAAGLSASTVIVEAPIRSGTLITAGLAIEYDREIYFQLPHPEEEGAYGGIAFAQSRQVPKYIQSLYDVIWQQGDVKRIRAYYSILARRSQHFLSIPENEHRHISDLDLKRIIFNNVGKNLQKFENTVIELMRLGMIRARKGKIVINFSWVLGHG